MILALDVRGSLHEIKAGQASMPIKHKIPIHSLLNFQFLKILPGINIVLTNFDLLFPFLTLTEY